MKLNKKTYIFLGVILLLILITVICLFTFNGKYTIEAKRIDGFSPDRNLVVYKNNKIITNYELIEYQDGTILCYSLNPTVAKSDIRYEKELVIVFENGKKIVASLSQE